MRDFGLRPCLWPLAACASLPSYSLVKERGRLPSPVPTEAFAPPGRPGLYANPVKRVNLFLFQQDPKSLQPPIPPRRKQTASLREAGFYARHPNLSTDFFKQYRFSWIFLAPAPPPGLPVPMIESAHCLAKSLELRARARMSRGGTAVRRRLPYDSAKE